MDAADEPGPSEVLHEEPPAEQSEVWNSTTAEHFVLKAEIASKQACALACRDMTLCSTFSDR